jgi:hypothetical protein
MCRIFTNAKILRGGFIAMAIQLTLIYNLNVISLSLSLSLWQYWDLNSGAAPLEPLHQS